MSGLRSTLRRIPLAVDAYELTSTRIRMRPTRGRVRQVLASGKPIRLELGGGYVSGRAGYINVDVTREADLFWDLRHGIPFPDASVAEVYSSHLLEHLTYAQGQVLLRECRRVLVPGGLLSVAVPNARLFLEAYLGLVPLPDDLLGWAPAVNGTTAIDAINYVAYMDGEHRYMFDQENLLHVITSAGFVDVQARDFDAERDLRERDSESIYACARKP